MSKGKALDESEAFLCELRTQHRTKCRSWVSARNVAKLSINWKATLVGLQDKLKSIIKAASVAKIQDATGS
jgi:hypothetical protein